MDNNTGLLVLIIFIMSLYCYHKNINNNYLKKNDLNEEFNGFSHNYSLHHAEKFELETNDEKDIKKQFEENEKKAKVDSDIFNGFKLNRIKQISNEILEDDGNNPSLNLLTPEDKIYLNTLNTLKPSEYNEEDEKKVESIKKTIKMKMNSDKNSLNKEESFTNFYENKYKKEKDISRNEKKYMVFEEEKQNKVFNFNGKNFKNDLMNKLNCKYFNIMDDSLNQELLPKKGELFINGL